MEKGLTITFLNFDLRLTELELEAAVNALYKNFYYFVREFDLMEERDYAPLEQLTLRICND